MKTDKRTNRVPTLWTDEELKDLDTLRHFLARSRSDLLRWLVKEKLETVLWENKKREPKTLEEDPNDPE